ncbi:MAG: hypothetical protein GY820_14340 [Gammaproteobacteria bacterium]|nr:hypothetical protein [Gammaproteobacteria bacterium]
MVVLAIPIFETSRLQSLFRKKRYFDAQETMQLHAFFLLRGNPDRAVEIRVLKKWQRVSRRE